jgi:membrane protein DedA with SNARE-associated domain
MEALFITWLKEYGYIILYFWSILEGEMGLVMAGIMTHTGNMNYFIAIFVAGLGGFTGDQCFFYLGRFNKRFMQKKLHNQRHKLAIASLLLRKYGWPIILLQRYLYGLRSIIPIAIGISNYSAKKFALINLISAWLWAGLIISPAYFYGQEILTLLSYAKQHWYYALPIVGIFMLAIRAYLKTVERIFILRRKKRSLQRVNAQLLQK